MKLEKYAQVVFIIIILGVLFIGYFYFFQISPSFVDKPILEKPIIEEQELKTEHIIYLLNELNAYKLHNDPFTKEPPVIKIIVSNENYFFTVEDNEIKESLEDNNPDIVLTTTKEKIFELMESSENALTEDMEIEILSDEKTLALKGYKIIYDEFSKNQITGEVINLKPEGYLRGINLSFLFFVSAIIGLIIEKI